MKIICCDKCHAFIPLSYLKKECKCGNISGFYYQDGLVAEISVKDKDKSRVVGVENHVRYGLRDRGECFKIPWDSKRIVLKET